MFDGGCAKSIGGSFGGQMMTATEAEQPRILRDLERLGALVVAAHRTIEALERKLGPVLRPALPVPPSPLNEARKDANELRSPAVDMIEEQCRMVGDVSAQINALIERLDT